MTADTRTTHSSTVELQLSELRLSESLSGKKIKTQDGSSSRNTMKVATNKDLFVLEDAVSKWF